MMYPWKLDPDHSELIFKIKHLMISHVAGEFRSFDAIITCREKGNFDLADVFFTIDVDSIFTNNSDRDEHLKSADFFDMANFPKIVFKGKEMVKLDEHHFRLRGDLTMKGITREIRLEVEYGGRIVDSYGQIKAGFSVLGIFNRNDWGITWNSPLDGHGFILGNDITLMAELQFIKQVPAEESKNA